MEQQSEFFGPLCDTCPEHLRRANPDWVELMAMGWLHARAQDWTEAEVRTMIALGRRKIDQQQVEIQKARYLLSDVFRDPENPDVWAAIVAYLGKHAVTHMEL